MTDKIEATIEALLERFTPIPEIIIVVAAVLIVVGFPAALITGVI